MEVTGREAVLTGGIGVGRLVSVHGALIVIGGENVIVHIGIGRASIAAGHHGDIGRDMVVCWQVGLLHLNWCV